MSVHFVDQLSKSLHHGFIHRQQYPDGNYSPKILINKPKEQNYVLSFLQEELTKCQSFCISVAFISKAGIAMLKTQLFDLALRGAKGKILISPYLSFNDPDAMRELLKLKNIEVRITKNELNMHAKCYLFNHGDEHVVILGSSNLTYTALKKNYEWNVKLTSTTYGDFINKMYREFDEIWQDSIILNEASIQDYETNRPQLPNNIANQIQESTTPYTKKIHPNAMQTKALASIQTVRNSGAKRAIVISATGTGKTYLSAFDVKAYNPNKLLFIVHREQILRKAMQDYRQILGYQENEATIYRSGDDLTNVRFVFATIQTLSQDENLQQLASNLFDYILIDEVHKAGAHTYQKVINHFTPKFLLGMTATPERTDGFNLYELFDYNVAYEIRLQEALDEEMLCPFMYYGVKDLEIEGELITDTSDFRKLTDEARVSHILEKTNYYGVSGQKVKGLIFCSSKAEAISLSDKLNQRGLQTTALTGDHSQNERQLQVTKLENGELDYILTVDIFNEGIDIPSVNQVVMLRNTLSSIIFIQQLGRGLRKHPNKEFVTIIDFIGNYSNNYLIPIALYGDRSMNKDEYRRKLVNNTQLNGMTTINFEAIAREQIFNSIKNTSLSNMKNLREAYIEMKNRKGRIPTLTDFIIENTLDPIVFFEGFKHFGEVVDKFEATSYYTLNSDFVCLMQFICQELLNGKRPHELLLLKALFNHNGKLDKNDFLTYLLKSRKD